MASRYGICPKCASPKDDEYPICWTCFASMEKARHLLLNPVTVAPPPPPYVPQAAAPVVALPPLPIIQALTPVPPHWALTGVKVVNGVPMGPKNRPVQKCDLCTNWTYTAWSRCVLCKSRSA